MLSRQKWSIGGSGSVYIYGFIDENYRPDMTKEECIEFVAKGKKIEFFLYTYKFTYLMLQCVPRVALEYNTALV